MNEKKSHQGKRKTAVPAAGDITTHRRTTAGSGLFGALVVMMSLVAVAGVGGVALLAAGVNPVSLWQPDKLLHWQNYLELSVNPLNVLALTCVGVLVLALLVGSVVSRAVRRASTRAAVAEDMLDMVTSLRLEDGKSWQNPALKAFPPAAVFAAEALGSWRLQESQLKHLAGLEGELRRLLKAVTDGSREGLAGRYDSPAVGDLVDEITQLFDEQTKLTAALSELQERDHERAATIAQSVQEARCWQDAATQNMELQAEGVDHLAGHLNDLVIDIEQAIAAGSSAAFTAFKQNFDEASAAVRKTPAVSADLDELVDKSTKLTFQIAMEVARLGSRGERLAPMSQSLEEVTTEIRQVGEKLRAEVGAQGTLSRSMGKLSGTWKVLVEEVKGAGGARWQAHLQQYGPAASQLSRNMRSMAESCAPQMERLTGLGSRFAHFAGVDFDAHDLSAGNPEIRPTGVFSIEAHTPFVVVEPEPVDSGPHQVADVDPFAVTPPARLEKDPADNSFTRSVDVSSGGLLGGSTAAVGSGAGLDLEVSSSAQQDPFAAEPALPLSEEKVYDLAEFGAVRLADPVVPSGEVIYELSEFGAVQLS